MPTALVTGGSAGLGRALATATSPPTAGTSSSTAGTPPGSHAVGRRETGARGIAGDVTDPAHREALAPRRGRHGRLDLLVNNASTLGPTPAARRSRRCTPTASTTSGSPTWPRRSPSPSGCCPCCCGAGGVLVDISSDAAVEHYEGWGGYAASKAALDHLTLTLGGREPGPRRVRRRPGGHADRDAPGRLPRRGHQRPPAAGDGRARACCALVDAAAAERPLPRRRRHPGRRVDRQSASA